MARSTATRDPIASAGASGSSDRIGIFFISFSGNQHFGSEQMTASLDGLSCSAADSPRGARLVGSRRPRIADWAARATVVPPCNTGSGGLGLEQGGTE